MISENHLKFNNKNINNNCDSDNHNNNDNKGDKLLLHFGAKSQR